jgi:hypothetical protein
MRRKHTLQSCLAAAQSFKTRGEWALQDRHSYMAAKKHGWDVQCMAHFAPPYPTSFTLEKCLASARKYTSRADWVNNDASTYCAAKKFGWFKQCTQHLPRHVNERTLESCLASARKFQTRVAWTRGDKRSACYAFCKPGWYSVCTAHMVSGFAHASDADRFVVYVFEFPENKAYVGVTRNLRTRVLCHRKTGLSNHGVLKTLEQDIPGSIAGVRETHWYEEYQRRGFVLLNKARPGGLGNGYRKHNPEKCLELMKKCRGRKHFCVTYPSSASAAHFYGWYDDCAQKAGFTTPRLTV